MDFSRIEIDVEHEKFAQSVREFLDGAVTEDVIEAERESGAG
jgi:hypothetical protein